MRAGGEIGEISGYMVPIRRPIHCLILLNVIGVLAMTETTNCDL